MSMLIDTIEDMSRYTKLIAQAVTRRHLSALTSDTEGDGKQFVERYRRAAHLYRQG